MDNSTMTVEAIENGTVIDHIPAGLGLAILRHFKLDESGNRITVGFNLKGKRGNKDLIKIQNIRFNEAEAAQIALFAPQATVNVIENFEVAQKIKPRLPEKVEGIFACPNDNCASHGEPVVGTFTVKSAHGEPRLKCFFCEKSYPIDWVVKHNK
ncbi:MAG: aspartate carbamoyltransferase regulatory subunit [Neisseriaceae bacterium]|nr:aspartate carbamoyltransferase regulatory subunit [Neisseriaceae bacterium]